MKKLILPAIVALVFATSCSNEKKPAGDEKKDNTMMMDENRQERNKKVVMASIQSFEKGDIDGMVKDAAADFKDYGDGSTPPVTNLDSLKGFIKMLTTSIEGYKPNNTMLVAEGDYVMAYATWTGTFKQDLMGIKATGKMVNFPDVDIFKLNDAGKIVEHRSVQNIAAILMAGM